MSEATRRIFFALWPDERVRAALAHATHKAVRSCGGRPVPVHNLHATLLFLGSVPESRIPDVVAVAANARSAMDDAVAVGGWTQGASLDFTFDRIEFW